jgi:hypothetical protein
MNSTLESGRRPSISSAVRRVIPTSKVDAKAAEAAEDRSLEYVVEAIRATTGQDGWAHISAVGKYLRTYTPFEYKSRNFRTLTSYLKTIDAFEIKQEQRSPRAQANDSAWVRIVR